MGSKASPNKLKPVPRPLFSCGIFRNCTQSVLSPTASSSSANLNLPPPPPPPHRSPSPPPPAQPPPLPPPPPPSSDHRPPPSSSSSSSSSTSPSFTQWRFPLHHPRPSESTKPRSPTPPPLPDLAPGEVGYAAAEALFRSGTPLAALRALEKAPLASDPNAASPASAVSSVCPPDVMAGVVTALRDPASARPAAKILLALLLVEPNRRVAVEGGAVAAVVEAVVAAGGSSGTSTAERSLAALELMCTVAEGASEVRSHALAPPAMCGAVEGLQGRGRECAIGVLAAAYGGELAADAPDEAVRAVMLAMQGECSARGRRKGATLLRALQECGRMDSDLNFDG